MKEINLSQEERSELKNLRNDFRHTDSKSYAKVCVILSIDQGLDYETIYEIFGVAKGTTHKYKKKYQQGGIELLLKSYYKVYEGKMSKSDKARLDQLLEQHIYPTSQSVVDLIYREFGIKYSESNVTRILGQLGYSYKKPKQRPSKADTEAQKECIEKMEQQMSQSTDNKSVVLFTDAVHPMHNTKPDYGWIKKGQDKWLLSNGGRKRCNIIGLVNSEKAEQVTIVKGKRINSAIVIELFKAASKRYPHKQTIHIWSDQARYYKSKLVKKWLSNQKKIQLHYLPAYSPNLNLIERLWKFMRKKVINNVYYKTFEEFMENIDHFFENIKSYKAELRSLITPKFQLFPSKNAL